MALWWCVLALGMSLAHEGVTRTGARLDHAVSDAPADARLRMMRAENAWRAGDYAGALEDIEAAEALGGARVEQDLLRGMVHVDQRRWNDALDALDRYVRDGGRHAQGFVARSQAREALGDLIGAESDLAVAMALRPGPDLAMLRYELYARQGKHNSAIAWLELDVQQLRTPILRKTLCEAQLAAGAPGALACTEALVAELPIPSSRALHVQALQAMGRVADAERERRELLGVLDVVVANKPTARLLVLRANLLDSMGEGARALEDAQRAVSLAPGWPEARTLLGQLESP